MTEKSVPPYEHEVEYDSIKELVSMGIQCGMIPRAERNDYVVYLKWIYKCEHFLDPTDIVSTDEGFRVPLTLEALEGLLSQRAKHIAEVKASLGTPQQKAPEFPDELNTAKAKELINKAVKAGFACVSAGIYQWNRKKVLLAYFAMKATTYLTLRKKDGAAACWKPFEVLFCVKGLKDAKAGFEKSRLVFTPDGYELIDALFDE